MINTEDTFCCAGEGMRPFTFEAQLHPRGRDVSRSLPSHRCRGPDLPVVSGPPHLQQRVQDRDEQIKKAVYSIVDNNDRKRAVNLKVGESSSQWRTRASPGQQKCFLIKKALEHPITAPAAFR